MIYFVPNIIMMIYIILDNNYYSEFKELNIELDNWFIILYMVIQILILILIIIIFKYLSKKTFFSREKFTVIINRNRWNNLFLFILIVQWIFYFKTGVGKAGHSQTLKFAFIFNLFNLSIIFKFYYFICREKKIKYLLNIILFLCLEIGKGWTGIVFEVFLYELYFFIKNKKVYKFQIISFEIVFLILGGYAYKFLYPLKNYIRYKQILYIDFNQAMIKLVERISFFSHSLVAVQNRSIIKSLYKEQKINFLQIKGFFRTFIPSFVMQNKDFRGFNNLIMASVYPDITKTTSSNMGVLSLIVGLYESSIFELLVYIIFLSIEILIFKVIVDFFSVENDDINILFFIFLFEIFRDGNLETVFYGWPTIFIFFIILFIRKGIRIFYKEKKR